MTQKEQFIISKKKNEVYLAYLELCIFLEEVPRQDVCILIAGCTNIDTLTEAISVFKEKMG